MPQAFPSQSLIVVGSGIVGLCIAVVAQARGHAVTLIARDDMEVTASGIAAGMVAPALESLTETDPITSFQRLNHAQSAWLTQRDAWPEEVRAAITDAQSHPQSQYVCPVDKADDIEATLNAMAAVYDRVDGEGLTRFSLPGDWLFEAAEILCALKASFVAQGGRVMDAAVSTVAAQTVGLADGETLSADHVVIAAGYGARAFADQVQSLQALQPIKGHLLDFAGEGTRRVVRSKRGYHAQYTGAAKFGASMQVGQDDLGIEAAVVADLYTKATQMGLDAAALSAAIPRTGIRASSPDGWPLIGRDAVSGVLVATAMRRNGFVFAPLAAQMMMALIDSASPDGAVLAESALYNPNRFGPSQQAVQN